MSHCHRRPKNTWPRASTALPFFMHLRSGNTSRHGKGADHKSRVEPRNLPISLWQLCRQASNNCDSRSDMNSLNIEDDFVPTKSFQTNVSLSSNSFSTRDEAQHRRKNIKTQRLRVEGFLTICLPTALLVLWGPKISHPSLAKFSLYP